MTLSSLRFLLDIFQCMRDTHCLDFRHCFFLFMMFYCPELILTRFNGIINITRVRNRQVKFTHVLFFCICGTIAMRLRLMFTLSMQATQQLVRIISQRLNLTGIESENIQWRNGVSMLYRERRCGLRLQQYISHLWLYDINN